MNSVLTRKADKVSFSSGTKRKSGFVKLLAKNWQLLAMIIPPMIFVIIFAYYPMYGAQIAFKNFSPVKGIEGSSWVGFDNFTAFMGSPVFFKLLYNTFALNILNLIVGFPCPIILALCLNQMKRQGYKKFIQTAAYIPNFISIVVIVGIMKQLLSPSVGIVNQLIAMTGGTTIDFFGRPDMFRSLYVISGAWQSMGWNSIIYFSALSSVSPELHEAALIDGANRIRRVWHIDLPAIQPTIIVLFIINLGGMARTGIDKVLLMQSPLNMSTSEVIDTYVYKMGIGSQAGQLGYSTAAGLFQSLIGFLLIIGVNYLSKRYSDTSLW